jgi:diacylglycerol O-acyltransferase
VSPTRATIPLSAEDRAILALEGPTVAGHTCKVILVGSPGPTVADLRELIDSRIDRTPQLQAMLGGDDREPAWVPDPGFDLERHVRAVHGGPVEAERLPALVAEIFEQRLSRERPLWQLDVVPIGGERAALIWRLHHAVADGTTAMRFASALLWDTESGLSPARPRHSSAQAADDERRRGHLGAFMRREFGESAQRSPFDGAIGTRRRVARATVPLQPLHDAAKRVGGATVNDAVLAIVAGGLRRWLEWHHGRLGSVRLRVPVSLHSEGDDAGNRDSFFTVPASLDEPDPVERLREIHVRTDERKQERDAAHLEQLMASLRTISPQLERLAERIEASARSFALAVSNVPGPRRPVSVLGSPVESMHSLAEIGRRHALRVAVVSIGGELCLGLCADPAIVDDLEAMARGVEAEAAELIAAAG